MAALALDLGRIERASGTIDPVFRATPQFACERLSALAGFSVVLKVETVNPIRCFKGRGGDVLVAAAGGSDVLACASAGNLGQGLAYAARRRGLEVRIFAAADANPLKLGQMRALGAQVELVDGDFDVAKDLVASRAAHEGWRLVVDGVDPELAEGAGSIAVELTEGALEIDSVVIPVGNGSLVCGIAAWMKAASPHTQVIAVGAAGSPTMERAWRTGSMATGGPTATIAEGLVARVPVPDAVEAMRDTVDRFVLVDDEAMLDAAWLLLDACGLVTEPAGAAALAGALALRGELAGARVAMIVGGANVSAEVFGRVLQRSSSRVAASGGG